MGACEYRLAEARRQTRLREIRDNTSVDCSGELALLRLLTEESLDGDPHLTTGIVEAIRRLSADELKRQVETRELLPAEEVIQLGRRCAKVLAEVLDECGITGDLREEIGCTFVARMKEMITPNQKLIGQEKQQ
jgi:hypothetical protein